MLPSSKLIRSEKNIGFAKAANCCFDACPAEYFTLLNTDIELEPDYFAECISALEEDPNLYGVSGILLRKNGHIDSAGHVILWSRLVFNRLQNREFSSYDGREDVFGIPAAAATYSGKALNSLKIQDEVFDSSYFSYIEDVDLDWRAALLGYKAKVLSKAVAIHFRHGVGAAKTAVFQRYILRNRLLTIIKNDIVSEFLLFSPFVFTAFALKTIELSLKYPSALKGFTDVQKLMPRALAWRKDIQDRRVISEARYRQLFEPGIF